MGGRRTVGCISCGYMLKGGSKAYSVCIAGSDVVGQAWGVAWVTHEDGSLDHVDS